MQEPGNKKGSPAVSLFYLETTFTCLASYNNEAGGGGGCKSLNEG